MLLPASVSFSGADIYSCVSPDNLAFQQLVSREKCENDKLQMPTNKLQIRAKNREI